MTPKQFNIYLDSIQSIILSFLVKLGPFFVALMPALFTGYATFHIFEAEAGWLVAGGFALVVSLAIETVGILATHTTIDLYNGWEAGHIKWTKLLAMALGVPVYVLGVVFTVWFAGDAFPPLVRGLGYVSPFLMVVVYEAVALARDLSEIKRRVAGTQQAEQEQEQGDKEHTQAVELEEIKHKQALELKELELSYTLREVQTVERARVKIEAGKKVTEPLPQVTETDRNLAATLPQWCEVEPKNRPHFRKLVAEGKIRIPAGITGPEFLQQLPIVGSIRSATNWLSDVKEQSLISVNSKNGV